VITLGSALSIRIIAAALAGTLLVACSPMADVGHESDPVCNPVRVRACGLPFPSDAFTVADPSSPTGRRVEVDDELVSELYRAQVPRSMWPSAVLDGASGFSSMAPVLFELDRPIDPATLPVEGGESFVVFDTADARRVAIRAEVDPEAAGSAIAA
jgi:hypothetical protein